jgi:hypothetical protein
LLNSLIIGNGLGGEGGSKEWRSKERGWPVSVKELSVKLSRLPKFSKKEMTCICDYFQTYGDLEAGAQIYLQIYKNYMSFAREIVYKHNNISPYRL